MTGATSSQIEQRRHAAAALREGHLRLAAGFDAAEACGWALAMLPQSRAAQRLMLDWLIASGQFEEAVTRAGALIHLHGSDWRILLRRAEALLALRRDSDALAAIEQVLTNRPHHRRALLLKAEIHSHQGDHAAALHTLELAEAQHPRQAEVARRLVESLLANDRPDDAAAVLDQMPDSEPELRARTLAAQDRLLDARLALEDAIHWELDDARRDHFRLMHLEVLEQAGDWAAIQGLAQGVGSDDAGLVNPLLAQRLAQAMLPMGLRNTSRNADANAVLSTARSTEATDAGDASRTFKPWLGVLLGSIVAEQIEPRHARRAGADPSPSALHALLADALATFDDVLNQRPDAHDAARWRAMRSECQAACRGGDVDTRAMGTPAPLVSTLRYAA